jgi:hypothetical protein
LLLLIVCSDPATGPGEILTELFFAPRSFSVLKNPV